jgi:hypothetical protein
MNYPVFRRSMVLMGILLSVHFALGCATVVSPVSSSEVASVDANHGLLVGTIHLTHGPGDLKWSREMKWWVEEQTSGSRIFIKHLPLEGPFVLKLPPGSYRVTDITFTSIRGLWHTVLPTTFSIQPKACTSLGTWELEMQTGFFSGWMTRHVSHEEKVAHDAIERAFGAEGCPTLVAPLESPVKSLVKLNFRTRGLSPH